MVNLSLWWSLRERFRPAAEVLSVWCPSCGQWVDPDYLPVAAWACAVCRASIAGGGLGEPDLSGALTGAMGRN